MNFQTNYYYDLPREIQWEIQSFVQVDKPTRHADAASIIKAKNVLVREHWYLVRQLSEVMKGVNNPLKSDIDDCLSELILEQVVSPTSVITMCDLNLKINYWLTHYNEVGCPLWDVLLGNLGALGCDGRECSIRFKPGIQTKACDKFKHTTYKPQPLFEHKPRPSE